MPEDSRSAPANYSKRKEIMFHDIDVVRRLWRGERVADAGCPLGKTCRSKYSPAGSEGTAIVGVTAAGNPETFQMAGSLGMNLLTHLLWPKHRRGERKSGALPPAWKEAGHTGRGHVTLMLHTFVGENLESVKATVREPLIEYLRKSADLIKRLCLGVFRVQASIRIEGEGGFSTLPKEEMDAILTHAFDRYFETSGLFGTPESCVKNIENLRTPRY